MHALVTCRLIVVIAALMMATVAACGSDDASTAADPPAAATTDTAADTVASAGTDPAPTSPTIVVTTNVLGDVVSEVVGAQAEVVTVMPVGADPHDFQASAREIDQMLDADALIVNGAGFEEGLLDVIESAETDGVAVHEAISAVATLEVGDEGEHEGEHEGEGHAEDAHDHGEEGEHEEHDDHEEHDGGGDHGHHHHEGVDPHFFTDPVRMSAAVEGIVDFLVAEVEGLDEAKLRASTTAYLDELSALDAEVAADVEQIPAARRILVTNHEVFGYFADRYGFEVVGVVIPSGTTSDAASAGELAELAELIVAEDVPAIFADTSSPDRLIDAVAAEAGEIEVVELYTESLGPADSDGATYLEVVQTNARRIGDALT